MLEGTLLPGFGILLLRVRAHVGDALDHDPLGLLGDVLAVEDLRVDGAGLVVQADLGERRRLVVQIEAGVRRIGLDYDVRFIPLRNPHARSRRA